MSCSEAKPQKDEELVVEEEAGVFERTIERISPFREQKRKQNETSPMESPVKQKQVSESARPSAPVPKEEFLSVPFWKQLNRPSASCHFQTREVGCFSLISQTDEKECFEDKRYLRTYKYPLQKLDVNFDLKVGESEVAPDEQSKNIDAMLWWTLRHKDEIFQNGRFKFNFLSWRGVLRLIMFSIVEKQSDWSLAVVKFKNAFFLCEYVTDQQVKDEQAMTAEHRSFCYYGHKFEEYVTKNATTDETWNPSKQFTGVFQSALGSYKLLYGAEMDCVVETSPTTTEHIELKVCAGNSLDDLPLQYNRKFAKWWIQCFLVGIKTMVIGLRDKDGIVNRLSPLTTAQIEHATHTWSRDSFLNFFSRFGHFVETHVTNEYSLEHKDVVLFHFLPSAQKITARKTSDAKYHFIPDWFFNGFT